MVWCKKEQKSCRQVREAIALTTVISHFSFLVFRQSGCVDGSLCSSARLACALCRPHLVRDGAERQHRGQDGRESAGGGGQLRTVRPQPGGVQEKDTRVCGAGEEERREMKTRGERETEGQL